MLFALGIIVGMLVLLAVICTLIYFRTSIEYRTKIIETRIQQAGPRPKGFVMEPESDADEFRRNIIADNRKMGRDTKLSELE